MAIIHQAELTPSKLELLQAYLPALEGFGFGNGADLATLGAYRFDDPAGEVGMETHLLRTPDGRTIHVPLTYRAAPLDGAEQWLIGTLEHSVLGTRWVYNGCGDPVYTAELVRTILTGGTQAELEVLTKDGPVKRENTVHVWGSGQPGSADLPAASHVAATRSGTDTIIAMGPTTVVVHHILSADATPAAPHLSGTWPGTTEPVTLAVVNAG